MIRGGCRCGEIRYHTDAEPIQVRSCWCRECQYWGSGSATVNIFFRRDAVRIDGALTRFESIADSGNPMVRGFCPKCGTPVTTGSPVRPDIIGLRVGTLDEPGAFPPQAVIWTVSAPGWACIDPALPKAERQS